MEIKQASEIKRLNKDEISLKKPYQTPKLYVYGELRDLTLGGSPGTGDSGNPGAQRLPV